MTQPALDDPGQVVEADWTWTGDAFESGVQIAIGKGGLIVEVGGELRRVGEELGKVVLGRVVERKPGRAPELRVAVLELLAPELRLLGQHLLLGRGQDAVEPPKYGERQDDVLVLAPLEGHESGRPRSRGS